MPPNSIAIPILRWILSIFFVIACTHFDLTNGREHMFANELLTGSELAVSPQQAKMLEMMQQKVATNPNHSDSWRSLGRIQTALGDADSAIASTRKAIELDAFNAAAHFDLGQLLLQSNRADESRGHFDQVFKIAPTSSYSQQLRDQGIESPTPMPVERSLLKTNPLPAAQLASYEIQTFDGSDDLKQRVDQLESEVENPVNRLRVFFETGVLYNSNVTLTPISRELAQSSGDSFQAFANPDIDWKIIRTQSTRMGPMFRGYFTANESEFTQFNLASFQPGAFAEHDFLIGANEAIGRLEYIFFK